MYPSEIKSMRHPQRRSERCQRRRLEKLVFTISLPDDLVKEVLSFLPVKSLTRLKCVAKSFKSFISEPRFIKMHLNRSSLRNMNLIFVHDNELLSFTVVRMLDNPPSIITLPNDPYDGPLYDGYLIGSCNGLLCLFYHSYSDNESWFRFWNPATRTISDKLGSFHDDLGFSFTSNYTFGYDRSEDTFKVVHFLPKTTTVRIFDLKDNVWRNIQNCPLAHHHRHKWMKDVHFSDTVNWLVICNYFSDGDDDDDDDEQEDDDDYEDISIEQFAILSLDLRTEKHTMLLPPQGFNEMPLDMPNLSVLNDRLCFSHDFKQTHFIIWQMKEFGVEDSWTQFLKISYHNLEMNGYSNFGLFPLCLSETTDTLLLTTYGDTDATLYNWRDNRATRIHKPSRFKSGKDYVESLVSYC